MSVPAYPSYRDSGVEWLRNIPDHWRTVRLRRLVEIRKLIAGEEGPEVLSITQRGIKVRDTGSNDGQLASNYAHYQIVEPGDFAMNHMDLLTGWVDISARYGVTSPDYRVFRTRPEAEVEPRYLLAVLQLGYTGRTFYALGQGASHLGRWRLPTDAFNDFEIALPGLAEQRAIAAFLDRETAKIDALVGEQRRLVELLREKRQAVISHAVTKGLDPTVPMKPSGVEWLGDVPAHWKVDKFTRAVDVQEGPGIMAVDFVDEGVPLLRVSGVQGRWASLQGCNYLDPRKVTSRWAHFRLNEGDLIISGSASTGTVCEVGSEVVGAVPYTGLIRLVGKEQIMIRDYVRALVGSSMFFVQIDQQKAGAIIQHFGPTHLGKMIVTVPPIDEQAQIAAWVDDLACLFDTLVDEAEAAITLLQERRAALISAAVTGKVDVRGLVPAEAEAA